MKRDYRISVNTAEMIARLNFVNADCDQVGCYGRCGLLGLVVAQHSGRCVKMAQQAAFLLFLLATMFIYHGLMILRDRRKGIESDMGTPRCWPLIMIGFGLTGYGFSFL